MVKCWLCKEDSMGLRYSNHKPMIPNSCPFPFIFDVFTFTEMMKSKCSKRIPLNTSLLVESHE